LAVNKLLILAKDAKKYAELISAAGLPDLQIQAAADTATAMPLVSDCNIILGEPSLAGEVILSAQKLEWLQSSWAGVEPLCKPGLRRDYVLTGVKDLFGPLISEYVVTYLFALERQVFRMRSNQLERRWQPIAYRSSREITLGIVGLGSIGRHLAQSARYFGIRVIGLNRSGQACDGVERVYAIDNLRGFLKEPDYVVLTLPDTPKTKNLIAAYELRMMKPSAVLMNVGRGSLINEADMVDALHQGIIGGAVLDVFSNEPLEPDNPLWQMRDVYITPHNAAISFTEKIVEVFIQNYKRFMHQKPLSHIIDFEEGY
jgi:phosphoglycerate dehydrogenase-like enzyme